MSNLIGKQVGVLDQGYIELQDLMGNDLAIVNAARTSFLGESKGDVADKKLLFYLMGHRHTSPFEMVEFKFRIKAPVVTWWQLVRHRTANLNMQSGRYTEFEEDSFYIPEDDQWRLQSKSNKQGSDGKLGAEIGRTLTLRLIAHCEESYNFYKAAIDEGVAREQARLFLPGWGLYYTGVWKIDARNLMNFLQLRGTPEAQYEIRVYAEQIYKEFFIPALPWTAEAFEEFML